jgi:hypothetical protein
MKPVRDPALRAPDAMALCQSARGSGIMARPIPSSSRSFKASPPEAYAGQRSIASSGHPKSRAPIDLVAPDRAAARAEARPPMDAAGIAPGVRLDTTAAQQ